MKHEAKTTDPYITDNARWAAVCARDSKANGHFYFAVETTGVYCLPSCGARLPKRENVYFYDTMETAEQAGYRPCKRCKPNKAPLNERHAALMAEICKFIEDAEEEPALSALAAKAGMSPSYFNRLFKKTVGITPKQYVLAHRSEAVKNHLLAGEDVTGAIYAAGYGASSRFYENAESRLGMKPADYRMKGRGAHIRYAVGRSWLGPVIVAATEKGICAVLFADNDDALVADLGARFEQAVLEPAEPGSDFDQWLVKTLACIEKPEHGHALPLDVKGTVFQEKVWRALRDIPAGETASYSDIARAIGRPKSVRAVAGACGANPTAVLVPCHRVVRGDGNISGYRWGVDRKEKLLEKEKEGRANG